MTEVNTNADNDAIKNDLSLSTMFTGKLILLLLTKLALKKVLGLFSEIIAVFNSRSAANTFLLENLLGNKMVVLTVRAALAIGSCKKTEETV